MALFAKKTTIPAQDEALPGRNTPLPISGKHFVNGSNIKQPAQAVSRRRSSVSAASGARSASSGRFPAW